VTLAYKEELILAGKLADRGALLEFTEDVLFNSPSARPRSYTGTTPTTASHGRQPTVAR